MVSSWLYELINVYDQSPPAPFTTVRYAGKHPYSPNFPSALNVIVIIMHMCFLN